MSTRLMQYINGQPKIGTLSTADAQGRVSSAYFGSPRMLDERTVVIGLGRNRTLANLQDNPRACLLIAEPARAIPEWKGLRLYLRMQECQTEGENLAAIRAMIARAVGEQTARGIQAAVLFRVEEIRPLLDGGQPWETGI